MKKKILFGVSLLFGLLFINSGLNTFFQYMPAPANMPEKMMNMAKALMGVSWLMPLIAIVQITGGVLFITNKFRALGAIIIFPVIVGIILTHLIYDPSGLPMALVVLAIEIWVIIDNLEKYLPMIRQNK